MRETSPQKVPASMQPPDKAQDLTLDMRATGLNHIAFDVGPAIEASEGSPDDLRGFLSELNRQVRARRGRHAAVGNLTKG